MVVRAFFVTGTLGLLCIWIVSFSNPIVDEPDDAGPQRITSLHMVNLRSDATETEFLDIISEFNEALEEIGYTDIRYEVWKLKSGRQETYQYFFKSTWPDQDTYDKVHRHQAWMDVFERYKDDYEKLVEEDVYNHYVPIN